MAVNPANPPEIFTGSRPMSDGERNELSLVSIFESADELIQSNSIHFLNTCFPVPRNKLCIGSITVKVMGSKYGSASKTEFLTPYNDSAF